jgi:hypothetical protein
MSSKVRRSGWITLGVAASVWASAPASATTPTEGSPGVARKTIPERLRAVREQLSKQQDSVPATEKGPSRFAQWFNFPNGFRNFPNWRNF